MGLDITAYSNTTLTEPHGSPHSWCEIDHHIQAFAYDCFPQSFRGLADADNHWKGFIGGRCYDISESKSHRFRAGSYGGYNRWRDRLRRLFQVDNPEDPFYELVYFADNEGCIGPYAAADLLIDFSEHRNRWLAECAGDTFPHDIEVYDDFLKACQLAADNGLIDFH